VDEEQDGRAQRRRQAVGFGVRTCSTCNARAPLCDACVDAAVDQFRGVAAIRGTLWGARVRTMLTGAWPSWTDPAADRLRAVARKKVRDLVAGDERLLEVLARVCAEAAAVEYAEPTQRPGGVSFTVGSRRA
jgi:hypothetical protein